MATDPKKDQKDQSEQKRNDAARKTAELTDEQMKDIAAGDPGRITPGGSQTEVRRHE